MSLLGVDVGTTGCKAAVFSEEGHLLASAYEEYDIQRTESGRAELDADNVWLQVRSTIRRVALSSKSDPIRALAVSSLGEAMVPVSPDRQVLGPSILAFDTRGEEYLAGLRSTLDNEHLYRISGNTWGNHYGLTKLKWIQQHERASYDCTWKFLPWASFVSFMLGGEPAVDYSLANRSLLFDIEQQGWSPDLLQIAQIDPDKLPATVPSGAGIGTVSARLADELGLPPRALVVSGAHDQCANAIGCGVIDEGSAMYGMGTFLCIVPVFGTRRVPAVMIERGLNTEHHAVPGKYVSFIYNQGGSLVKWFRDTFAATERNLAAQAGRDIYTELFRELPQDPSTLTVLPHFSPTGPPKFIADSCGALVGLHLDSTRGDVLKGIIEGATFYLRECVDSLPPTGIGIRDYRAVGGGSRSDAWIQVSADIMGRPFVRPRITEAGTLGAAIIAGIGCGIFANVGDAVVTMVHLDRTFEPDPSAVRLYQSRLERYQALGLAIGTYLQST